MTAPPKNTTCVRCNHPTAHTQTDKGLHGGQSLQEMHFGAPGRLVTLRLEDAGDDMVGLACPLPLSVTGEPVG